MPLFFPSTSTLFEYLPDDSIFILDDHVREAGKTSGVKSKAGMNLDATIKNVRFLHRHIFT